MRWATLVSIHKKLDQALIFADTALLSEGLDDCKAIGYDNANVAKIRGHRDVLVALQAAIKEASQPKLEAILNAMEQHMNENSIVMDARKTLS